MHLFTLRFPSASIIRTGVVNVPTLSGCHLAYNGSNISKIHRPVGAKYGRASRVEMHSGALIRLLQDHQVWKTLVLPNLQDSFAVATHFRQNIA